jgi:hypothetical protein
MAGLLMSCATAAAFMGIHRDFFEGFIKENYVGDLPLSMRRVVDPAVGGSLQPDDLSQLTPAERVSLYEYWMSGHDTQLSTVPPMLVVADPQGIIARAERTLVSGSSGQKFQAVTFLELAGSREAVGVLRRRQRWAVRQRDAALAGRIVEAIERLSDGSPDRRPPAGGTP